MTRSYLASALVAVCATAPVALAEDGPADQPKPKLLVMPFATLSGDVAPRLGLKASGMLSTELKSSEKFELVEPKKATAADAASDVNAQAKALVDEAKALRAKKKFRLAEEALQKALTAWRAGAAQVGDVADVVDALALLSAVQFNTGRDEEGAKSLNAALALAPDRDLPLAQTSALFAKVVSDARKALRESAKTTLAVESTPSNAGFTLDGVTLGSTPLLVREVPPGQHLWRTQLPNGEVVGGVVDVVVGKPAQLKVVTQNKDPDARLLASVAQNKLDAEVLSAAKEVVKAADADVVVFGALSHEGKGLALDAFAVNASSSDIRRLPRATFDTELLSAGMEFFNLAGEMAKKGAQAGESVKVPSAVATGLVASAKQAEVRYGQAPGRDLAAEALEGEAGPANTGKEEPRKPLDQRRVPLKKK